MATFSVDVSASEFLAECNEEQKKELIRTLIEDEDLTLQRLLDNEYVEKTDISKRIVHESSFETEIGPDDYLDECSEYEKEELVKSLVDLGYIEEKRVVNDNDAECAFDDALESLKGKKNLLSKSQEEYIIKLAKNN